MQKLKEKLKSGDSGCLKWSTTGLRWRAIGMAGIVHLASVTAGAQVPWPMPTPAPSQYMPVQAMSPDPVATYTPPATTCTCPATVPSPVATPNGAGTVSGGGIPWAEIVDPQQILAAMLQAQIQAFLSLDPETGGSVLYLIDRLGSSEFTERQAADQQLREIANGLVGNPDIIIRRAFVNFLSAQIAQLMQQPGGLEAARRLQGILSDYFEKLTSPGLESIPVGRFGLGFPPYDTILLPGE